METNQSKDQQPSGPQQAKDQSSDDLKKSIDTATNHDPKLADFGDVPIEDPAAQSEAGPEIYDIGMGGPGATSSGLRPTADDDTQSDEA